MSHQPTQEFATSDLYLASYLKGRGCALLRIGEAPKDDNQEFQKEPIRPSRFYFIFSRTPSLEGLVMKWHGEDGYDMMLVLESCSQLRHALKQCRKP